MRDHFAPMDSLHFIVDLDEDAAEVYLLFLMIGKRRNLHSSISAINQSLISRQWISQIPSLIIFHSWKKQTAQVHLLDQFNAQWLGPSNCSRTQPFKNGFRLASSI